MGNEILFSESQKFTQWWLWLILLLVDGILIAGVFMVLNLQALAGKPIRYVIVVLSALFIILPAVLFLKLQLETQVKRDGIYVRFFPFQLSFKEYKWTDISKSFIRQYDPIGEYGGWGMRFGPSGKALNVSGNSGLQLEFQNHQKLLVGTNKPVELAEALKNIGQLKQ